MLQRGWSVLRCGTWVGRRCVEPAHHPVTVDESSGVEKADIHQLSVAASLSLRQRQDNAEGAEHSGNVVDRCSANVHRFPRRCPLCALQTGQRASERVAARAGRVGPPCPERCDLAVHGRAVQGAHIAPAESRGAPPRPAACCSPRRQRDRPAAGRTRCRRGSSGRWRSSACRHSATGTQGRPAGGRCPTRALELDDVGAEGGEARPTMGPAMMLLSSTTRAPATPAPTALLLARLVSLG